MEVARGTGGGERRETFGLTEQLFDDREIRDGLAAAGLAVEKSDPWSPFDIDAPGKTLWLARKLT